MARTDAIVLGAGIVGVSVALQLARRGLSVVLVDRSAVGEETSYGNSGIIGGAGVYPSAFPRRWLKVLQVGLKRAPEANYHWGFLPQVAPWLFAYWRASSPAELEQTARVLRPFILGSAAEHEALLAEAGGLRYLRKDGWIALYRRQGAIGGLERELALVSEFGIPVVKLDADGARALEPSLAPVFRGALHWPRTVTVSSPLGVTRAYATRFAALGGVTLKGDARSLHRANGGAWRVETDEGAVDAEHAVIALGPWAPEVLAPLGVRLPLAVKRGYHRHFRARGNAGLTRPVLEAEIGYILAPMEQGIRLTTGAEFAHRDAKPTPVQFDRIMPYATSLFPLGERADDKTWMGRRPCLPDSIPVIGRAPGHAGLWLAVGHGHMGLSYGPLTGRLIADMITGVTPFCDPAPFRAERFS